MDLDVCISQGQREARERWGTQESGAEFDLKKSSFLTRAACTFIEQQTLCVIVGPGPDQEPCGLLLAGLPGFIETPDEHTCLIPIDRRYEASRFRQGLHNTFMNGSIPLLALCLIQHITRQRICVQGNAEIYAETSTILWLRLSVNQAFFHCPKYIHTRIPGLTAPGKRTWTNLAAQPHDRLTEFTQIFLSHSILCYLCTLDRHGQPAVNHRGGACGFLVTLPPDQLIPGGVVLLPDYTGNGAFEALGNILETGLATLLVPSYTDQLALCISGEATILEPHQLPVFLRGKCRGGKRVITLVVKYVEYLTGDWSDALLYEQKKARELEETAETWPGCFF